jgi:hypothetical protein
MKQEHTKTQYNVTILGNLVVNINAVNYIVIGCSDENNFKIKRIT